MGGGGWRDREVGCRHRGWGSVGLGWQEAAPVKSACLCRGWWYSQYEVGCGRQERHEERLQKGLCPGRRQTWRGVVVVLW